MDIIEDSNLILVNDATNVRTAEYRKANFWVNVLEDSNLRWGNIGMTCSTSWTGKTLCIELYEMKISGRLSRGFKPQIYRCCCLIIYLLTFTNFVQLLFLSHTNNFVLFASWLCHQKVFQMQLLRSAFSGPISRALPKWELLSCLGKDWIIGSSLGKDLKCIWNFEFKLQLYFKDYHEMCIFGIEDRLGSEPF